jgi:hypothetical protein
MSNKVPPGPLQIFALTHLAVEELIMRDKEEALNAQRRVTHSSFSSVLLRKVNVSVWELTKILPYSVLPEPNTVETILKQMHMLLDNQLLEEVGDSAGRWETEYESFSITGNGNLWIRKYYGPLASAVQDRKEYDRIVDSIQGDEEIKSNLKNLWPKFKGKTQDAVIEIFFSFVKKFGPGAIVYLIFLVTEALRNNK